ncbi:unnamed protein product [Euphydryas editha]|uniref:Transposase n=1 Tax=Euphydryas editha TaxID=104508 RepID=A0AAU9V438_EUPED|nr:unnamed protein product [Euphydryas editha]
MSQAPKASGRPYDASVDQSILDAFAKDDLFEDIVVFEENRPIVFQQDGCPAHYTLAAREYLDNCFPNAWIGRDGPIEWPARSPDLMSLNYYVWGRTKELVYTKEIFTKDQLIIRKMPLEQ